jgi:hypothetical protein
MQKFWQLITRIEKYLTTLQAKRPEAENGNFALGRKVGNLLREYSILG